MSAFGEQNYGTPPGAIRPGVFFDQNGVAFYDFSGFSSRSGAIGFSGFSGMSGFSGFSAFCGPYGLEFIPFKPTLTFPLNFAILQGVIDITWKDAVPADVCGDGVAYELQFTRTFSRDSGWKTLASDIPPTVTAIPFDVSDIPFTEDGGLRIRARDSKGLFSDWSTSNEAFTIANHAPNPVVLLSPVRKDTVDYCLPVIWREAPVRDIDGQPVTYIVEMTDAYSKDVGWTVVPGAEALPQGTTSFTVNCFDFPEGSDYGVRVTPVDELGLGGMPKKVGPIIIAHQGNFFIDTVAPEGSMIINNGDPLATSTKVRINLFAFDATTGVKDLRFRNADEDCFGDFDTFVSEKFWDLPQGDGVKRVYVQFRDFANNISSVCDCEIISRVLCDEGNATDIEVFNNKLYVAFDQNGNLVEYKVLVKRVAALAEPSITALARFTNFLYVATFDPVAGTVIYSFDGVAKRLFGIAGAKANSMVVYNGILYIGLEDGRIMSYDGISSLVSYVAGAAITRLRNDGAVLFAAVQGAGQYLSFDGTTWKINPL